jgi:FkbM family methyltransferase
MDVGANHGHWTRSALNYFPESYYTLIEPQDSLKKDVHDLLTRGGSKIRWIGAGAGDKPGTLPLTITDEDHDYSATFTVPTKTAAARGFRQIEVPMVTLNEIVRTSDAPFPEMVKIDAEGFDLRVIAGASELLGRTDIFLLETAMYPHPLMENTHVNVITTMSVAGYHVIDITELVHLREYGVLLSCEIAFLRNESRLFAEIVFRSVP